jgi:polyhydroxybutyrate depolymerase
MWRTCLSAVALATLACAGPTSPTGGWLRTEHLTSGGLDRTAFVHVPTPTPANPPLILVFHGGQGDTGHDGLTMAAHWEAWADRGYVLAFPNGLDTGERAWAGPDDRRDVDFTDALIDQLVAELHVDPSKVYATGFSNGSGFVWMLECLDADRFAGFGHVQQSMAGPVLDACRPSKHVPTIWFHGDADRKARWDGNALTVGVPRTMAFLEGFHRCDPARDRVTELPDRADDGTTVTRTEILGCADVPALELFTIHGGEHHWPTTRPTRSRGPGRCRDVDAADETVRFWRQYGGLP